MQGWIKLDREILNSWMWTADKVYTRAQAYIYLLLNAAHTEHAIMLNGELYTVKQGEIITSERKLAETWGWSRKKVSSFLMKLSMSELGNDSAPGLVINRDRKRATLTLDVSLLCGFLGASEAPVKNQQGTSKEPVKHTYKNGNNGNKVNNVNNITPYSPPAKKTATNDEKSLAEKVKFAEFVSMTNDEYLSLVEKYGESDAVKAIEILDNYKGASGKKYKSDYRAILSWVYDKLTKDKPHSKFDVLSDDTTEEEFEQIMREKMED